MRFFYNKAILQLFRFVVSGGISAILEIGLLVAFVDGLGLDYLKANIFVFVIGGPINFLMNKYWVFEKGSLKGYVQIVGFISLALLNLVLNQFLLWLFVEYFFIDYRISKVLAIGLGVLLNFLVKKYLIFEKKKGFTKDPSLIVEFNRDLLSRKN